MNSVVGLKLPGIIRKALDVIVDESYGTITISNLVREAIMDKFREDETWQNALHRVTDKSATERQDG